MSQPKANKYLEKHIFRLSLVGAEMTSRERERERERERKIH